MKTKQRILSFLFAPAGIGTALFVLRGCLVAPRSTVTVLTQLPVLLLGAVVFSLVPAAIYTVIMETWLRVIVKRFRSPVGRLGVDGVTLVLSTGLGTLAGWAIQLASEAPVTLIGAITGIVMGGWAVRLSRPTPGLGVA